MNKMGKSEEPVPARRQNLLFHVEITTHPNLAAQLGNIINCISQACDRKNVCVHLKLMFYVNYIPNEKKRK